jgi:hypothetical protein
MTLTDNLSYWLRGTGRRRAADTIPLIEAERDHWKHRCAALEHRTATLEHRLALADGLIADIVCANQRLQRRAETAEHNLEALNDAHNYVLNDLDELSHRNTALRIENANLKAIYSPAPADGGPAIPLRNPEDTVPIPVFTLWDAHGLPAFGSAA